MRLSEPRCLASHHVLHQTSEGLSHTCRARGDHADVHRERLSSAARQCVTARRPRGRCRSVCAWSVSCCSRCSSAASWHHTRKHCATTFARFSSHAPATCANACSAGRTSATSARCWSERDALSSALLRLRTLKNRQAQGPARHDADAVCSRTEEISFSSSRRRLVACAKTERKFRQANALERRVSHLSRMRIQRSPAGRSTRTSGAVA